MDLGLEVGDGHAWFWRRRPAHVIGWLGEEEGQQFALAAMIRVVRAAAGPRWIPRHIQLESATATWVSAIPELAACRIDRSSPVVAIAVPYELLDRSTSWRNVYGLEPSDAPKLLAAEENLAGSLRQAFASLLPATHPSIEMGAEIAGLSPRTLRRRLAEEGSTWRKVVDQARLEACERMLREPDLTLEEIAARLRYSDQAHLTRAFRRWTGECPSAYRRRRYLARC
jgi:AraC-like DNA-binding protein